MVRCLVDVSSAVLEASTSDGPMAVLHKRPVSGTHPTVVMLHDGPGIRSATHVFAEKLAGQGFEVLVPDLFHRHGRLIGWEPHERAADPSLTERLWEMVRGLTDLGVQSDVEDALAAHGTGANQPFAAIGFCLGARAAAHTLARRPEQAVAGAMWHPSFLADDTPGSPHHLVGSIRQPLLIGIGGADTMQPAELHRAFLERVAPLEQVEVVLYPGAEHGFTWPDGPHHDAVAAEDCFARTVALLATALGRGPG